MDSEINDFIEKSDNDFIILIKVNVDKELLKFKDKFSHEERNEIVYKTLTLIEKKHIINPNFLEHKKHLIKMIARSYIISKIAKDRKGLRNSN